MIKVKKLTDTAVIPTYATPGAACFDLVADEDIFIEPMQTKAVSLGLAFEIPEGYEVQIRPRSGISGRTLLRVANAPGTIDCDYRGEVKVIFTNTMQMLQATRPNSTYFTLDGRTNTMSSPEMKENGYKAGVPWGTFKICKGDRIAQGKLEKVERAEFVLVDELSQTERGEGGFGSTGV